MRHGICLNPLVPLRAAATKKSEMTDQVLFGEDFEVLEVNNQWMYIKRGTDAYEGWFNSRHYLPCTEDRINQMADSPNYILHLPFNRLTVDNNPLTLPAGSILPFFSRENKSFKLDDLEYILQENLTEGENNKRELIEITARQFLNAPYLWGGKTIFGMDCSGFTQILYRIAGINIPRDSHQQVNHGTAVNFVEEAQTGDLAFFINDEGRITHTGIMLEEGRVIHASGKVRVDPIDRHGIYNRELKRYTHRLEMVKRVID